MAVYHPPAICDNCHIIFPVTGIHIAGGTFETAGAKTICPKCGGTAFFIAGIYRHMGDALHGVLHKGGIEALQRLVEFLKDAQRNNLSQEQVATEIAKTVPELSPWADSLPKTTKALDKLLYVAIGSITAILASSNSNPTEDDIKKYIKQEIQNISLTQDVTQDVTQEQGQEQGQKQNITINNFVQQNPKIGRNQDCPCGSGKKFKKCHGKK